MFLDKDAIAGDQQFFVTARVSLANSYRCATDRIWVVAGFESDDVVRTCLMAARFFQDRSLAVSWPRSIQAALASTSASSSFSSPRNPPLWCAHSRA
jgi:hypothetical protein